MVTLLLSSSLFLFTLGQLGRISFYNQQINVYGYEIAMVLFIMSVVFIYGFKPITSYARPMKSFFILFLVLLLSYILNIFHYSIYENAVGFLYMLRLILYVLYLFYALYFVSHSVKSQFVMGILFVFSFLLIFVSFLQYFLYPELRNLIYGGWDPHLYRAFGTFFDTSVAGAIFGLMFLFFLFKIKSIKRSSLQSILCLLFFILLILSFSRTAYIAVTFSIIVWAIKTKHYIYIGMFAVLFIALLTAVPKPFGEGVNLQRTITIKARLNDFQDAFTIWKSRPLLGVGYNRIRYEKAKIKPLEKVTLEISHAGAAFNSSFLIILVTGGIIGCLVFIYALVSLAFITPNSLLYIIFLGTMSLSDNILLHPFVLFLLFTLISLEKSISRSFIHPSHRLR